MTVKLDTLFNHKVQFGDVVRFHSSGDPNKPSSEEQIITQTSPQIETFCQGDRTPVPRRSSDPLWSVVRRASQNAAPPEPTNPYIVERIEREIKCGNYGHFVIIGVNHQFVNLTALKGTRTPAQLRTLAKKLTDLADAHEAIYPPDANTPNLDHL